MRFLRERIQEYASQGKAIGHFNAGTLDMVWAIFRAAQGLKVPVIVGFSEGERDFIGVRQAARLIQSIREQFNFPIFSNADHTFSFERVKEAVDAGFDSVIFDGAELSLEENIKQTRQCVDYVRTERPSTIIEGELGFIGKSSSVRLGMPDGVLSAEETKPEEAARFVRETCVDLFAPAVGNVHGMHISGRDPALNIDKIKSIRESSGVPLVLHGASGNTDEEVAAACAAGVSVVHFSTELRVAYRKALQLSLQSNADEVAPYKYMKPATAAVEKIVSEKLKILNRIA